MCTPLRAACVLDNISIALILLNRNADPNIVNMFGGTCLMSAVQQDNFRLCKLLIKRGANVLIIDDQGYGVCHFVEKCHNNSIRRLFLDFCHLVSSASPRSDQSHQLRNQTFERNHHSVCKSDTKPDSSSEDKNMEDKTPEMYDDMRGLSEVNGRNRPSTDVHKVHKRSQSASSRKYSNTPENDSEIKTTAESQRNRKTSARAHSARRGENINDNNKTPNEDTPRQMGRKKQTQREITHDINKADTIK
jgi:hypothetical protein